MRRFAGAFFCSLKTEKGFEVTVKDGQSPCNLSLSKIQTDDLKKVSPPEQNTCTLLMTATNTCADIHVTFSGVFTNILSVEDRKCPKVHLNLCFLGHSNHV